MAGRTSTSIASTSGATADRRASMSSDFAPPCASEGLECHRICRRDSVSSSCDEDCCETEDRGPSPEEPCCCCDDDDDEDDSLRGSCGELSGRMMTSAEPRGSHLRRPDPRREGTAAGSSSAEQHARSEQLDLDAVYGRSTSGSGTLQPRARSEERRRSRPERGAGGARRSLTSASRDTGTDIARDRFPGQDGGEDHHHSPGHHGRPRTRHRPTPDQAVPLQTSSLASILAASLHESSANYGQEEPAPPTTLAYQVGTPCRQYRRRGDLPGTQRIPPQAQAPAPALPESDRTRRGRQRRQRRSPRNGSRSSLQQSALSGSTASLQILAQSELQRISMSGGPGMSGDGEAPLRLMLPRPLLQPASASPDSMEAVGPSLVSGEDDGSTEGGSHHHHHREHRRQGSGSISTNNPLSAQDELSGPEEEAAKCQIRQWPHEFSFLFALMSCTLGMFSISRFAILTIDFGPVFLVQFLLLTFLFGIPMILFYASVGQYLGSGLIDMWRISPIFQGIGVALMLAQGLYCIYNITVVAWLFVYFRDSFITAFDRYKWSFCFNLPTYGRNCDLNGTNWRIEDSIPDYFSGTVLLRSSPTYPNNFTGELRFQTLFNIVVIWMAVFIGLCKGLRSYGKVVYIVCLLSTAGFLVFVTKVVDVLPASAVKMWLLQTDWMEFINNGRSWICAARECFFVWGILGATILQMASHNKFRHSLGRDVFIAVFMTLMSLMLSGILGFSVVSLIRSSGYDYTSSSFETFTSYGFLVPRRATPQWGGGEEATLRVMRNGRAIKLGEYYITDDPNGDGAIPGWLPTRKFYRGLDQRGVVSTQDLTSSREVPVGPVDGSVEDQLDMRSRMEKTATSTNSVSNSALNQFQRKDDQLSEHVSFLAGIRVLNHKNNPHKFSGYQVMRLATELIPTYTAILGPKLMSPFWVILFYFTMILLGLSQQMALVHTIASGLIAIRPDHFLQFESSLTFMSCLLGLVFSFPMATEFGAFIVYFLDYTIGCGWWLLILYAFQMFVIFVVRGWPYTSDNVATVLINPNRFKLASKMLRPYLAFFWTVILPIGLTILCIVSFKFGRFSEMFDWTTSNAYLYMPSWVREIGAMMQILPLLLVPFVAVIQSCRYFLNSNGAQFHQRVNNLYRPMFHDGSQPRGRAGHAEGGRGGHGGGRRNGRSGTNPSSRRSAATGDRSEDPPPKYTPPPSYSTATGARIARFLRQSFRQSMRRIRGDGGNGLQLFDPAGASAGAFGATQSGNEHLQLEERTVESEDLSVLSSGSVAPTSDPMFAGNLRSKVIIENEARRFDERLQRSIQSSNRLLGGDRRGPLGAEEDQLRPDYGAATDVVSSTVDPVSAENIAGSENLLVARQELPRQLPEDGYLERQSSPQISSAVAAHLTEVNDRSQSRVQHETENYIAEYVTAVVSRGRSSSSSSSSSSTSSLSSSTYSNLEPEENEAPSASLYINEELAQGVPRVGEATLGPVPDDAHSYFSDRFAMDFVPVREVTVVCMDNPAFEADEGPLGGSISIRVPCSVSEPRARTVGGPRDVISVEDSLQASPSGPPQEAPQFEDETDCDLLLLSDLPNDWNITSSDNLNRPLQILSSTSVQNRPPILEAGVRDQQTMVAGEADDGVVKLGMESSSSVI